MIPGSSKKDNDLDPDEINLIFCNIRNYSDWAGINFDSAVKLYYNTKHFSMQTNVTDETITTILGMCYTTNELMDKVKVFPLIKFIKNNSLQVITQNSILEKFGQNICLDTLSVEVEMIKKLCRALVELELISRLDISKQHQLLIEKGYDANQVSLPKNNTSSKERSVQTIIDWIRSTQEYHVERNTEEMIASPPIP
jgi:hypothetical protein